MAVIPELDIRRSQILSGEENVYYDLVVPHGSSLNIFYRPARLYTISDLEVDDAYQKRGIGKTLLRASLEHAISLKADAITAYIVSRECLYAMRSIFGQESLEITREGHFADTCKDGDTIARLWHNI